MKENSIYFWAFTGLLLVCSFIAEFVFSIDMDAIITDAWSKLQSISW